MSGLTCINCTDTGAYINTNLCVREEVCENLSSFWFEYTAQSGINGDGNNFNTFMRVSDTENTNT